MRKHMVDVDTVTPTSFIDMGLHYLRDMDEPANIHQVGGLLFAH